MTQLLFLYRPASCNYSFNRLVTRAKTVEFKWETVEINLLCTSAFNLTLMRLFSITRLGSNQANQQQTNSLHCAKSTTDQLFALRQILEKCNEFNITTHHLFIDFKAAYDP
jgi:hypothetical protein